jgi:hypothetical protein
VIAWMFSSATRRSVSVWAAFFFSIGPRSLARPNSSVSVGMAAAYGDHRAASCSSRVAGCPVEHPARFLLRERYVCRVLARYCW